MKVYLDENLSPVIAELLRQHSLDAASAQDVGNAQLDDRAQLRGKIPQDEARGSQRIHVSEY